MTSFPTPTPDPLDQLLSAALKAQAEPAARADLAQRAMARAKLAEEHAAALMRLGRWIRWCSVAAGLLVFVVLGVAWWIFSANSGTTGSAQTIASSGESGLGMDTVGCALLLITLVGMTFLGLARGQQEFTIKNLA